jgi:carboxypeptidase C (cathepsin A)
MTIIRLSIATLAVLLATVPARAQEAQVAPLPPAQKLAEPKKDAAATPRRTLPADSVTRHTVELPGRKLEFVATVGKLVMENAQGMPDAEISYVAYSLPGQNPRTRPITFALNGGPGSASAWLHIGGLGPWRLPMVKEKLSPSAIPELMPNAETWLDFTDLVFIDPVGTGYSQLLQDPADRPAPVEGPSAQPPRSGGTQPPRSNYYSVEGDITSLSDFIRRYLDRAQRTLSPKILVGESYAGFRAPKMAAQLQREGVGLNMLVIVSPVLDFGAMSSSRHNPAIWLARLPSYAAVAREKKGPVERKDLADIEAYATGEFLADLMRGERDAAAVARIVDRMTDITGLDKELVKRLAGRIDVNTYLREIGRSRGEIVSIYDATVGTLDPNPYAAFSRTDDAFAGQLAAPMTSAITDLINNRLGWKPTGRYRISNMAVFGAWDYGRGGRLSHQAVDDLKIALALDRRLEVVVAHGTTDVITPYFQSKLLLDQLPPIGDAARVRLAVYPGGHMFYSRDPSRISFRSDIQSIVDKLVAERQPKAP